MKFESNPSGFLVEERGFQLKINAAEIQTKADKTHFRFAPYAMGDSEKEKKMNWVTIVFECLQMEA